MNLDRQMRIELYRQGQPIEELRRKAEKASRRGYLTQEDIDLADAEGNSLYHRLGWDELDHVTSPK